MQATIQDQIRYTLRNLGFAPHHAGYKLLITAILLYMQDMTMSITKEIYPALVKQFRLYSAVSIEHSMRYAISEAWTHGPQEAWNQYFPQQMKAPSNMAFISMLAEHLR